MPRVLFTISYGIKPEARADYEAHVARVKNHLTTVAGKNYSVFEVKGKKDQFMELFITESVEEFDALEDNLDPESEALIARIEEFTDDGGMKYTTYVEKA
jgi:hypothetical protein